MGTRSRRADEFAGTGAASQTAVCDIESLLFGFGFQPSRSATRYAAALLFNFLHL
jgi:hypothetical protein